MKNFKLDVGTIEYCIESKTKISYWNSDVVIRITGWVFSSAEGYVELAPLDVEDYRIYRMERTDIKKKYSNTEKILIGFCLDLVVEKNRKNVMLCCRNNSGHNIGQIDISLQGIFLRKRNIEERFPLFFTNDINDINDINYCIDSLNLDDLELVIRGWAFSKRGKLNKIVLNDKYNAEQSTRTDVVSAFENIYNVDADCGVEFKIFDWEKSNKCNILFEAERAKIIINISSKTLCNFKYNDNDKKDAVKTGFKEKIKQKKNFFIYNQKYGKEGAKLKFNEEKIFSQENELNEKEYVYKKFDVPDEWINIQKKKPKISVVIATNKHAILSKIIENFDKQQYKNWEIVLVGYKGEITPSTKVVQVEMDKIKKEELLQHGLKFISGDYVMFMDQEDEMDTSFLSLVVEKINLKNGINVIASDYDIVYNHNPIIKIEREKNWYEIEKNPMILNAVVFKKELINNCLNYEKLVSFVRDAAKEDTDIIKHVAYHYSAVMDTWDEEKKVKLVAFYLTQFHITEENNKWWGEGFTEWTNVRRGEPQYEGHNQPRIPSELGYYDLVEDNTVQYKQIELAKEYGLAGFCYYYYWFEGKRLLRKPLDQFLENKKLDFPFCICWANETWSRRWDGQEHDILIKQVHNEKTDKKFIQEMIGMFNDSRYIKIDGKPLLLVYRIDLFPKPYKTIKRWKQICKDAGIGDIHVSIVQSFGIVDHRIYGADSAVEFPPHKIYGKTINGDLLPDDSDFCGNIFDYRQVVDHMSTICARDYNLIPGCMLAWDNTARKGNSSNIFHGFTLELYRKWLIKNYYYTLIYNNSKLMVVNAWNEWAEGTYLEPDEKYGRGALEITADVLHLK